MKKGTTKEQRIKRHLKVRTKVFGTVSKPRLCVFRSGRHTYAQLIDDASGKTLAASSDMVITSEKKKGFVKVENARAVGFDIAAKAKDLKIKEAVFDRGGFIYTGRVKALADGAREGGLKF
jgi:large subunit ribosomal protein L18